MRPRLKLKAGHGLRGLQNELREASQAIRVHLDSEGVLAQAAKSVQKTLHPDRTSIWLAPRNGGSPTLAHSLGGEPGDWAEAERQATDALRRGRPRWNELSHCLAVPIEAPHRGSVAAICLERATGNADQHNFVEAVAREAGLALEAARLYEQAVAEKEKAEDALAKLKDAEKAKTLFLATASHELKTPLTVIQGFSDLLQNPAATDEQSREQALEAMNRRAHELHEIVERILLSSRIDAGRTRLAPEPVELGPLTEERVTALRDSSSCEIALEIEPDLPRALADPRAIVTVVDHLLDNARKYSPKDCRITVSSWASSERVHLAVADRGIGMNSEQVKHCFEQFWQAESEDARRFGGTGIGLYIVRSLVESMGGEVTVESRPGEGSTFNLTLPLADGEGDVGRTSQPGVGDPSIVREFMRQIGVPTQQADGHGGK